MKSNTIRALVTGLLIGAFAILPAQAAVVTYTDGTTVVMNPNGTVAGLNVGTLAGDPSGVNNGDLWYSTSTNTLRARVNGATVSLADTTNIISNASTGGNGAADGGKLAKFDPDGDLAAESVTGDTVIGDTQVYSPRHTVTGGISYGTIMQDPGAALSSDRTYYVPDASGTLALDAEVPKALQVRAYGAIPGDGTDDTAAIQAALNAASAAGGGRVEMEAGTYNLVTIYSAATANKVAGGYALEIPSNVTLAGAGAGATLLSVANGGEWGVGVAISPMGMQTATTNWGAATNVKLEDFSIAASVQHESAGNLINLVHASYWTLTRLHIGGCYYHGLEVDQSHHITLRDCIFKGAYTGISGTWFQFDLGAAGPVNRPAGITTRAVEDITFEGCIFQQRTAGESSAARDGELTHNPTELVLNRITFRGCQFTGRAEQNVSIIDIGGTNTGGSVTELLFEGCLFVTTHPKAFAFYMAQASGMTFRGIRFRGCEFRGPSATFLVMGGSVTSTYSATHSLRWEGEVTGCRFLYDKTQMVTSLDMNLIIAVAWSTFQFRNNYFECTGDFPVSVGSSYSRLGIFNNSLYTEVANNRINWSGNTSFGVSRAAFLLDVATPDNAGTTTGVIFEGNQFYIAAATGFSYGFVVQRGTSIPATSAERIAANWANGANSAQNNVVTLGTNTAGQTNGGALGLNVRTVSGATTITPQDGVILCNTASASITVTAANVLLRRTTILVKTSATNNLTCGSTTVTAVGAKILVVSDGTTTYTYSF